MTEPPAIASHYRRDGLVAAITQGLARLGKSPENLTAADLAPIDEFHVRGRQATLELAAGLAPAAEAEVLDIGCGLGGPSRLLAADYQCRVTGIDLTEEYCEAATCLAQWVGLGGRVRYLQASALDLPFPDGSFDAAWTQHVAMNVADKERFYAEAWRVLKPGGRFALYDVLQGEGGPIHFPVPWARQAEHSHLEPPGRLKELLAAAGFVVEDWRDTTAAGRRWFSEASRRIAEKGLPPLGTGLLLGEDFPRMAANMARNLNEDRVVLIQAVCRRPS